MFSQKSHFDIDISLGKLSELNNVTISGAPLDKDPVNIDAFMKDLTDHLIDALVKVFQERLGVILSLENDFLFYTSHGPDKRSVHLIINNYCHPNNEEAKLLYQEVIKLMPVKMRPYIDHSVYSPSQQFRILGSQKINSGRPKTFSKTFMYHKQRIVHKYDEKPEDDIHEAVIQLGESLVSFTSNCNLLISMLDVDPNQDSPLTYGRTYDRGDDLDIDSAHVEKAIELLADMANITPQDPKFPYVYQSHVGSIISLRRVKPSFCRICQRVHEHENTFLRMIEEAGGIDIYFYCRRNPAKNLYVGKILNMEAIVDIQQQVDVITKMNQLTRQSHNPKDVKPQPKHQARQQVRLDKIATSATKYRDPSSNSFAKFVGQRCHK